MNEFLLTELFFFFIYILIIAPLIIELADITLIIQDSECL